MMKKFAFIKSLSIYLPEAVETNDVYDEKLLTKLGIKSRHVVDKTESAADIAYKAAEKLFAEHDIDRQKIDFILLCTQYPDYISPTTACILQSQLNIPKSAGALDFSLGCSGYVYGLSLAKGLIESNSATNILFLTSSITSKLVNPLDKTIRPLFGDAATATLISAVDSDTAGIDSFTFGTDGSGYDKLFVPAGGSKHEFRSTEEVFETDERGNQRSNFDLHMDGNAITYFSLRVAPMIVEKILTQSNLTREQIDYYIFHQVNKFMLEHIRKKCNLEDRPFYCDIEDIGNTVASSIPIGISRVVTKIDPADLKRVMLAGFGVGLSWAGCIVDLSQLQL